MDLFAISLEVVLIISLLPLPFHSFSSSCVQLFCLDVRKFIEISLDCLLFELICKECVDFFSKLIHTLALLRTQRNFGPCLKLDKFLLGLLLALDISSEAIVFRFVSSSLNRKSGQVRSSLVINELMLAALLTSFVVFLLRMVGTSLTPQTVLA